MIDESGAQSSFWETLRARVRPRRTEPQDAVALRVVVLVAVLAAATALMRTVVGSPILWLVTLFGIPSAFWVSYALRHKNRFWLKVALAVGVLFVFASFLREVSSMGVQTLGQSQVPLAELFIWIQLLHSFDLPSRRDLKFSLMSSLTLVAAAGVLSISMAIALHVIVWWIAFVAALVLFYRSETSARPALSRPALDRSPHAGAGLATAQRDLRALARPLAVGLAAIGLVAFAVYLLMPAPGGMRALTFPARLSDPLRLPSPGALSNPSLGGGSAGGSDAGDDASGRASFGYFGFADELDTSLRGRPDDTVVMRVQASEPAFWRGQTFDSWDGRAWSVGDDTPTLIRAAGQTIDLPESLYDTASSTSRELVQTFHIARGGPNMVFAAYSPSRLFFPDNGVFALPDGALRAGVALNEGAVYTVISQRPDATEATLRSASGPVPADIRAQYTQIPESTPERVRRLASNLTRDSTNTYDAVRALEGWMARNTEYSLDIPPLPSGADAVDQYLFEDRIGFCEQIGSSLVVMLRSLDIPARLVVGFTPGERNPVTGLFEVKASDAHSWAEVYFPGVGWQGFDPTAKVPLAGDAGSGRAATGLVDFISARLPSIPQAVLWVVLAAFVAGLVVAVAVHLTRSRRTTRDARGWAARMRAELEAIGAASGRPVRASEPTVEYARSLLHTTLPDDRVVRVAREIDRAAFGPGALTASERADVESTLAELATLADATRKSSVAAHKNLPELVKT